MSKSSRKVRNLLVSFLIICVGIVMVFLIYLQLNHYPALPESASCYTDNPDALREDTRISFLPSSADHPVGVIIYPGGNVGFEAYAPLAGRVSASGYPVFVQKMPLNLAVFGIDSGIGIINDYPEIDTWVITGHSLGGAMAARFAANHPEKVSAIVFLAAYPDVDLKDSDLSVLSITGDKDGILNEQRFSESQVLLPEDTEFLIIPGANHAGFGHYGPQRGDGEALITREQQQNQVAKAIVAILDSISGKTLLEIE